METAGLEVTPRERRGAIYGALAQSAPPIIATEYGSECCIASTRIACDVLMAGFGIMAVPLRCSVIALSAEFQAMMKKLNRLPTVEEQIAGGAWSVGLGLKRHEADTEALHLAAWVPDDAVLVDLSLGQASRPRKNLALPEAMVWSADGEVQSFLAGESHMSHNLDTGAYLEYNIVVPDDRRWMTSPNWGERDNLIRQPLVSAIVKAIKHKLGSS